MRVLWSALTGGVIGTLVLTTMTSAASGIGRTRMGLPFLLGTTVTADRRHAKAIGYLFHFLLGIAFALAYVVCLHVIGRSG